MRSSFQAHTGTSPQTITFDQPQDVFLGQPVTLSASTDAAGRLPVSFRSDSPTVCTVSDSEVTTVRVGTCDVTAFQGGSATYAPAEASISFHVNDTGKRIPQQISFGPVPTATVGVPVVLTASSSRPVYETSSSPTGLAVSYSSRNQQVCTVSGATVVPWTAGLCVITASQDGNAEYQPAEPVTQKFTVERAAQTISFTPPASATIDQSVTLTATASSWLPVTYNSSTPNVCTVSGATVAATAAGTCTIAASQPGDGQYAPADSSDRVLPGPEDPADDQLHTAGERHDRQAGHPDRHGILRAAGDLRLRHPGRVHRLRHHAHRHQAGPAPSPPPSPATASTRRPTP